MAVAFVTQEELCTRLRCGSDLLILDVRRRVDYDSSSLKIRGAVRLPPDEVKSESHQLPRDKEIIVYSHWEKEQTGQQVVQELRAQGFERAYPLIGGFQQWLSAGLEMEPK